MINSIYRPNKSKINRNSKSLIQNVESAENFIKNESLRKEDVFRSETIDVSLPQLKKDSSQMMLIRENIQKEDIEVGPTIKKSKSREKLAASYSVDQTIRENKNENSEMILAQDSLNKAKIVELPSLRSIDQTSKPLASLNS